MTPAQPQQYEAITLTEEQESQVVQTVKGLWSKWEEASAETRKVWDALVLADKTRSTASVPIKEKWRARTYLAWAYNANRYHIAYMASSLFPNDFEVFALKPKGRENTEALPFMQRLIEARLKEDKIERKLLKALSHWTVKGMAVSKVIDGPDGPTVDVINPQDFGFYPVVGPLERCNILQKTYRYKDELEDAKAQGAPYGNLDKLTDNDETRTDFLTGQGPTALTPKEYKREGIRLIECWMPRLRLQDGTIFKNVVATIAGDKTLIRFQDGSPRPPFLVSALKEADDQTILGVGLCYAGLPVLYAANKLVQMVQDGLATSVYGLRTYNKGSSFNPMDAINRPGGFIAVDDITNLQTLPTDYNGIVQAVQNIDWYADQFEQATIPRNLKGSLDQGDRTAFETAQANQNASTDIAQSAKKFADEQLEPWLTAMYDGIAKRIQQARDAQDLPALLKYARIGLDTTEKVQGKDGQSYDQPKSDEQLLSEVPQIPPLDEIEIEVVGYQNVTLRDQQLGFITSLAPIFSQIPGAVELLNGSNLLKKLFRLGRLDPEADLLSDDEVAKQAQQAAQSAQQAAADAKAQQEILNQQQQFLLDTQRMDVESKDEIARAKVALEEQIGMLKLEVEAVKAHAEAELKKAQARLPEESGESEA